MICGLILLICSTFSITLMAQQREPWQWSWETIESVTSLVRAGKDLTPQSWPGGNRVAVALSFDLDNESPSLRDGESSPSSISQGEYGSRAGLPRILLLLRKYAIKASFFMPAVVARLYPESVRQITGEGHEIGVHGWIHERNSLLSEEQERELMGRAIRELERMIGKKPVGIRTPSWDYSPHTLKLIQEYGFLYDSSLMADDRPYQLLDRGKPTRVVELPVEWILDDYPYFGMSRFTSIRPHIGPEDVLDVWKKEFDVAYQEGTLFVLTMHPHIIGHRSRVVILEKLIQHMKSFPQVWFATHEEIARVAAQLLQREG